MKKIFSIIFISAIAVSACKKSVDFIGDNTTPTGVGYYPISSNPLVDLSSNKTLTSTVIASTPTFAAGSNLNVELQYFSQSPIKEVNLYSTVGTGARTKVFNKPYTPSFSQTKRVDTLLVPYQVPTAASGTNIKLEFEIVNENALNLLRTGWLKVQ